MADKAMNTYLNDHLAGATLGSDLAKQMKARHAGTALGQLMDSLATEIEEDRQTLIGLMRRFDTPQNPIKQASTWVAEKVSRLKFSGLTSGEPALGAFMAVETLALGVQGKLSLWNALAQVADQHPVLGSINLAELIDRAERQYDALEGERIRSAQRALGHSPVVSP